MTIANYFDNSLLPGTETVPTRGYIADVLTDEALRVLSAPQRSLS